MTEPIDSTATAELMAERYGVGSPGGRRLAVAALAVGCVALLGWLAWSAWFQATTAVTGTVETFEVVSAHRVTVTVDIHRPADAGAQCTVQAQAVDHSVVGETVLSIPAGGSSDVRLQTMVRTERAATSADVSRCR